MISITCTNCQSVLTMDDAFAGGVCRCQFCGTIQTVPSKKRSTAHLAGATTAKTLYQQEAPAAPSAQEPARGTGLDDLAEAVAASSGLAGSGLVNKTAEGPSEAPPPVAVEAPAPPVQEQPRARLPVVAITAAAVILAGVVVLIVWLRIVPLRGGGGAKTVAGPVISGPNFCGIPLGGSSVIFILDRGNSMADCFDALKGACYKTLKQLGPDRKFQVILWDNDAGSVEFPAAAMRNATAGAIEDCQRDFQDTSAAGRSHLSGPLREAIERRPQTIVIATGKLRLDEDDTAALSVARGAAVRVSVVQIGSPTNTPQLEELAKSTGGVFKLVSADELREAAR
jgi:hypothetical protein